MQDLFCVVTIRNCSFLLDVLYTIEHHNLLLHVLFYVLSGNAVIVGLLLEARADLNITSTDGMMPIHKAASEGHLAAVDKLIAKGALVNFCTSTGSTPLHYAASAGKVDVLRRLVEADCPVNAMSTGSVSCTALYCAASNGQLEAMDLLLEAGAEVDTICTNECTALHVAASNGHSKVGLLTNTTPSYRLLKVTSLFNFLWSDKPRIFHLASVVDGESGLHFIHR